MPIKILKNTATTRKARITCEKCKAQVTVTFCSPAAPDLTACEEAHEKHGWGYQVGFFSMLTGEHYPLCPKCAKGSKHEDQHLPSV